MNTSKTKQPLMSLKRPFSLNKYLPVKSKKHSTKSYSSVLILMKLLLVFEVNRLQLFELCKTKRFR